MSSKKIYTIVERAVMFKSLQKRYTIVERIVTFKRCLQKDIYHCGEDCYVQKMSSKKVPLLRELLCSKDVYKKDVLLLRRLLCSKDVFKKDILLLKGMLCSKDVYISLRRCYVREMYLS